MKEFLTFLATNPQLLVVVELIGKIILCVLGIIIYRRTGKVLNFNTQNKDKENLSKDTPSFNPADGLTIEELEEFAVCLSTTVDKIHELRQVKK